VTIAPSEAPLPLALFALTPTLEITPGRRQGYVTGSAGAGTPSHATATALVRSGAAVLG
jgi:hypothetical protein